MNPSTYDVYAASAVKVIANIAEMDPALIDAGYALLKWERPEKQTQIIELTPAEKTEALRDGGTFTPRFIDFWLTTAGKSDPKPGHLEQEWHGHSAATAWVTGALKTIYNISEDWLVLRNPTISDQGRVQGYLYPSYQGGLILGGMELKPRLEVHPYGITPIIRDEVTGMFTLGREFVPGFGWMDTVKAKEGSTQVQIDRAHDWCKHSQNAINKYYLLRRMLVRNEGLRVDIFERSWKYASEVLRGAVVATSPADVLKSVFEHVEAKKQGTADYKARKEDPELVKKVPAKVAKWGLEGGYFTETELKGIPVGTLVRVMMSAKSGTDVFSAFWSGDMQENNEKILSRFASEGNKYTLRIVQ